MSIWVWMSGLCWAQDVISLELVQRAQQDQGLPRVSIIANVDTSRLVLDLRCGSTPVQAEGALRARERLDVDIPLRQVGPASCSGSVSVSMPDGSEGAMPLAFDVALLEPLHITVDRASLDLDARSLQLSVNRPASRILLTATGPDGDMGDGEVGLTGIPAGTAVTASWYQPDDAELLRLRLRVEDADGFWSALDLFPWHYAIPHEDVIFETGAASVRDTEAFKLEDAMSEIDGVKARYGQYAQINLYVAGYTDTVGSASSNRALSEQRARAIATWFRQAGFSGDIFYQGFGEAGLMVPTGDEVDEAQNRRAAYIIAAEAPPVGDQLPGSHWKPL